MNRNGPVIVIEDDKEDQEILIEVFEKLGHPNELCFFGDGQAALDYLNQSHVIPFLILSDINMPKLDGFALRDKIKMDANLHIKCIPYLFFSTAANQKAVVDAYSMSAQGFFVKQNSMAEMEKTIKVIMGYGLKTAGVFTPAFLFFLLVYRLTCGGQWNKHCLQNSKQLFFFLSQQPDLLLFAHAKSLAPYVHPFSYCANSKLGFTCTNY